MHTENVNNYFVHTITIKSTDLQYAWGEGQDLTKVTQCTSVGGMLANLASKRSRIEVQQISLLKVRSAARYSVD